MTIPFTAKTPRSPRHAKRLAILGVLCVLAVNQSVAAATPVELRPAPTDDDGQITLGDLFEGAGRASSVLVAPAAAAGSTVLDAGRVQMLARQAGLTWPNAAGVRRLVVRSGPLQAPSPKPQAPGSSVEALIYTRSLAAGESIAAADIAYAPVQGHLKPADAPVDPDAVIGKAAKKALRAGAAVSVRDLASPRLIAKDDVVAVAYAAGGITLTLQGKALNHAAFGEPVQVKNPQSNKIIQAVATGPGAAVVGAGAERLRTLVAAQR